MAWETNETWGSNENASMDDEGLISASATRIIQGITDNPYKEREESFKLVLPALGSIHPRLGLSYTLKSRTIKQISPNFYEASLQYRTPKKQDDDDSGGGTYPWNEPAIVKFSTINESGETEVDANGDEIETVNGESFSVTKDYADQGIVVDKAFLSYSPAAFYEYINSVNSDEFLGFPAGTLRVTGISASQQKHETQTYWQISVSISARRPINTTADKAWYWRGAQKGTLVKNSVASSAKPVPATEGGKRVTSPVYINENGTKRTGTQPIHYLEIQIYDEKAFSGMNLFN